MLRVVQGDVFEFGIGFCNLDPALVEKIVFTSKKLGIEEVAFIEDDEWRIRICGERTKDFPTGFIGYDITVYFIDGESLTVEHNSRIEVQKKINEVKDE